MQAVQVRLVVALTSLTTDCPATQVVRAPHAVAGLPSSSHVVPPQVTAAVVPPAQYSPGLHASHTGAAMLVLSTGRVAGLTGANAPRCARQGSTTQPAGSGSSMWTVRSSSTA